MSLCAKCGTEIPEKYKYCEKCESERGSLHTFDEGETAKVLKRFVIRGALSLLVFACYLCYVNFRHAPNNYMIRADKYAEVGDYGRAIEMLTKVIKRKPDNSDAYQGRGYLYGRLKNYDAAIADLSKAIEINPNIELAPNNYVAYINRGYIYSLKGDLILAFADINKAIELAPNQSYPYSERGRVYSLKGDHDLAIADFDKAIELDSTSCYNRRGVAYSRKGDFVSAIENYEEELRRNPQYQTAARNLELAKRGVAGEFE